MAGGPLSHKRLSNSGYFYWFYTNFVNSVIEASYCEIAMLLVRKGFLLVLIANSIYCCAEVVTLENLFLKKLILH